MIGFIRYKETRFFLYEDKIFGWRKSKEPSRLLTEYFYYREIYNSMDKNILIFPIGSEDFQKFIKSEYKEKGDLILSQMESITDFLINAPNITCNGINFGKPFVEYILKESYFEHVINEILNYQ